MSEKKIFNSETHPQVIDFIDSKYFKSGNATLGMTPLPGRNKGHHKRTLKVDLDRIVNHYHINVVVTLVQKSELIKCEIADYFDVLKEFGLESYHFPIKDKWLPDSLCLIKCVNFIMTKLSQGKRVVVHCNGGKGRAATICASVLMAQEGYDSSKAISIIQSTRSGTLRNPLQVIYLSTFQARWNQQIKNSRKKSLEVK